MTEYPNLDLMRQTLDAFRKGDVGALEELFSPDVVWRVPGRSTLANDYHGQDEVFSYFGRLMELTGGSFSVESVDMLANDHGGVFVDRLHAARDGKQLSVNLMLRVTIRDGKITEGVAYFHPEHVWDAFWD